MNNMLTRRQVISTGLGCAASLALTACGSSSSSSSSATTTATTESAEGKTYKVAMLMTGIITDGGWDQGHYESLVRACETHSNWEMLTPKENIALSDAATAAQSYVDQGVDLIIGNGNEFASNWSELIGEVAETHPDVHFLITNTDPESELTECSDLSNVETVLPNFKQCGAVAGVIAGLITKTKSIGFIAGMKLPSSLKKYSAYICAAQKVDPEIVGQYNFEAGFTDAAKGTELASQWISTYNVDTMWGDASAVDNGVRQALETAGADTHYDIAQPIDIVGADQPTVVASTITDWMVGQAMDEIEAGTYGGGVVIDANLENGGLSLGKFSDKIDADMQAKIDEYLEQIKADTLLTDEEVQAVQDTL